MVLGGIHVQFSKIMLCSSEAAIPVLGRTIENGTTQEWKKLLTVDDLNHHRSCCQVINHI